MQPTPKEYCVMFDNMLTNDPVGDPRNANMYKTYGYFADMPLKPLDQPGWKRKMYKKLKISERHRHRYEVNHDFIKDIENAGLKFTGTSLDGRRMEVAELKGHPFYIATQFHPEFKSRPSKPSPTHLGLVMAAGKHARSNSKKKPGRKPKAKTATKGKAKSGKKKAKK